MGNQAGAAKMAEGFDFREIHCQPTDEGGVWTYLPARADVARNADGSPQLTWVELGATAYLLFTATWAAPAEDVDALRGAVAERTGTSDPATLRLSFAPLEGPGCRVQVAHAVGAATRTIATSGTSQVPPYDAVFSLTLRGDDLAAAGSALQGQPGRLVVQFDALRRMPVRATGTFRAPGPALRDWIAAAGPHHDLEEILDSAVCECIAEVRVDSYVGDLGPITTTLYERLLHDVALRVLPESPPDTRDLVVTVTVQDTATQPVGASADIGSIVAAQSALVP